jgi:hypothetical protein
MQKATQAHGYFSKEETDKRAASKKKTLDHIRIHHADNGGHIVEHSFNSEGGMYHEPERHVFGDGEGDKMLAHVAKHMKVKHPDEAGKGESAPKKSHEDEDGEDY